jgi:hypothetical protein
MRQHALAPRQALSLASRKRHISVNTYGVIYLTLPIGAGARGRGVQTRQQIGQPTQVVVPEMGPARADHHRRIVGNDIGPLERKSGELSRVVMEVDAVLAPRLTAID